MRISLKFFLEKDDQYVLGPGRMELLRSTQELGSLRKAAQKLGMSYRWAWGRLSDMEKALDVMLLTRGGGSPKTLTPEGHELLNWYEGVERNLSAQLDKAAARCPAFLGSCAGPSDPTERPKKTALD